MNLGLTYFLFFLLGTQIHKFSFVLLFCQYWKIYSYLSLIHFFNCLLLQHQLSLYYTFSFCPPYFFKDFILHLEKLHLLVSLQFCFQILLFNYDALLLRSLIAFFSLNISYILVLNFMFENPNVCSPSRSKFGHFLFMLPLTRGV